MRLIYSEHARDRMAERAITEQDVEQVLSDPDIKYTDSNGNPCYVGFPRGRRVQVVVAKDSNPPYIKTAIANLPGYSDDTHV